MDASDGYTKLADLDLPGGDVLGQLYGGALKLFAPKGDIVGGFLVVHLHTPDGRAAWGVVGVTPGDTPPTEKARAAKLAAAELITWANDELAPQPKG